MRSFKILAGVSAAVAVFVAAAAPLATAGIVDCTFGGGTGTCFSGPADWGTLQAPSVSQTLTNGSYTEQTYENASGVWTYVFDFTSSVNSTNAFSTGLGSLGSHVDTFDSTLAYGNVTDMSTGGGTFSFSFDTGVPSTLTILMGIGLSTGETAEFYGQASTPPGAGVFSALDGGAHNGPAVDPSSPVPEPSSSALFLAGAAVLLVGLFLKRKEVAA